MQWSFIRGTNIVYRVHTDRRKVPGAGETVHYGKTFDSKTDNLCSDRRTEAIPVKLSSDLHTQREIEIEIEIDR